MKFRKVFAAALIAAGAVAVAPSHASYYAPGSLISSEFVLGPTVPGKWGPPVFGTPATVTYSFMPTATDCSAESAGCSITALGGFGPAFGVWHSEIVAAFAAWSAVSGLTFIEVPDDGNAEGGAAGAEGDIRIGGHVFDGAGGVLAHAFYPPVNGATFAGDLHFDTGDCWEAGFDGTGDGCFSIFQVAAHEIGHSIGLDHTLVPASLMNPFYTEAFAGPQADDIAGAVFIYGPPERVPGVPEPGSVALLGLGLLAAFAARRRSAQR